MQDQFPFRFYFYYPEKLKMRNWENHLNFFIALFRPVNLHIGKISYILRQDEVFMAKGKTNFYIEAKCHNTLLCFELNLKFYDKYYNDFSKLNFQFNNDENSQRKLYEIITSLYIQTYDIHKTRYLKINELLSELGLLLLKNYVIWDDKEPISIFNDRIDQIIGYISQHFNEKITLADLSSLVHLNPQYLSRFFSKCTNSSLEDCIAQIRLQASIKDLCHNKISLAEIALKNGFANQKAFAATCKKYLGITPQNYRKNLKVSVESENNITKIKQSALGYFEKLQRKEIEEETLRLKRYKVNIDVSKIQKKLSPSYRKIIGFMRASDALRASLRDQLRTIQRDMPFEYVRFHGIFSDDMMVYNEDTNGKPILNFNLIDEVLDFLEEIKLKPFLELGYMPEKLASEERYLYKWHANISGPNHIEKWDLLIKRFLEHIIERYGEKKVCTWFFEIWDEPDYKNRYYPQPQNLSFPFLKNTLRTIKEVNPDLKVGVLNLMDEAILGTEIVRLLYQSLKDYKWKPDFCSFSVYSFQYLNKSLKDVIGKEMSIVPFNYQPQNTLAHAVYGDAEQFSDSVDKILALLKKYPIAKSTYIDEWNLNPDPNDFLHDTCFKAPFILKNALSNCFKVDGMGYWVLSDIFDEVIYTDNLTLHGGLGLLTDNGIKKPAYYAFLFLSKLGPLIIYQNDFSIVTKNFRGELQILIYNYNHFANSKLPHRDSSIRENRRYKVFNEFELEVEFEISGMQGRYKKKTYRVNRENGSVYDDWIRLGAEQKLSTAEIQYLAKKALYEYCVDTISLSEEFVVRERLKPHEILLITLEPEAPRE